MGLLTPACQSVSVSITDISDSLVLLNYYLACRLLIKEVDMDRTPGTHVGENRSAWRILVENSSIFRCATNRKVAGSIPAGVIGIFH